MTTKTITPAQRNATLVEEEIRALEVLIHRRNNWLQNNKNSKTFEVVKRDTVDMAYRLKDLKDELKELETNQ